MRVSLAARTARLLTNLDIRTKLLMAMAPLVVMVLASALYASIEMKRIDGWHEDLIGNDVAALRDLTDARAQVNAVDLLLYKIIAEIDGTRIRQVETEIDGAIAEYGTHVADAVRHLPALADEVGSATALFDQAVVAARAVRAANALGDNEKSMQLMRDVVDVALQKSRRAMVAVVDGAQRSIDRQAKELAVRTRHTIALTWLFLGLALTASVGTAVALLRRQVVDVLMALQGSIEDVAAGRLDRPVPFCDRDSEIGRIGRALRTLQQVSRERENLGWIKGEVATIAEVLQTAPSFPHFGRGLLSGIGRALDLVYGGVYRADEEAARLERIGGFGVEEPWASAGFGYGEGLVGQCAIDRRPLAVALPRHVRVPVGPGALLPPHVLILPVLAQDRLVAVLELGTTQPPDERQRALLEALLPTVAWNLGILAATLRSRGETAT